MYMHEKTVVSQVRIYKTPDGYQNKAPYDAILTLHYIGDDEVFIEGLQGSIDFSFVRELISNLQDRGIKLLRYFRNGDVKVVKLSKNFRHVSSIS